MSSYIQAVLNDNPQAYYRLDESTSTTAHDLTTHAYNGMISGGVTLNQAGALINDTDTAMLFDGSSGYITLASALKTDGWSAFTLECWVKLSNTTFTGYPCLIANDYPKTSNNGFQLFLSPSTDGSSGYIVIGNGTTWFQVVFGNHMLGTGWYHIVATYDGAVIKAYINGGLATSGTADAAANGTIGTAANPLSLARYPGDGGYLPGTLDEVAIYNYALSSTQVANHYAAGITGLITTNTRGYVALLINDVYYPTIRQETIAIDRTANDPISSFKFTLQDDPSHIALSEMQEIVFIDAGKIANPAHNLLQNPTITPYGTSWTAQTATGGTITQLSPGVTLALSNATGTVQLSQQTQPSLVVPGQSYCLSVTASTAATLTNCAPYFALYFFDAMGNTLSSQTTVFSAAMAATRVNIQLQAPQNAVYMWTGIGISQSNATNAGSVTFTNIQMEPMTFASGNTQLTYPTPFCANGQPNCTLMPDGTAIRQYRLFGGYITKATAGRYVGNNRQWTVQASGYAWLLQKQLLNDSFTSKTDSFIISNLVNKYFPKQFSTAQVATGATLDVFGYTYNGTMRDALDALASNANFNLYIDAYRTIYYQPPGYNQLGFMLSDQPDGVMSFPYYNYSYDIDGTQLGNACLVTGGTNISAVEYDAQSIGYYNQKTNGQGIFWRTVNDGTIGSTNAARQRAIAEISQYNYARQIVHLSTQQMMIPGYTVLFTSSTDGLYEAAFLIQKSTLVLQGFTSLQIPRYECSCDIGAFNPDLVNISVKLLRKQLTNANNIGTPVIGLMATEEFTFVDNLILTIVRGSPATYGMGTYGTSTYAVSIPGVPPTRYGSGVYGDSTHGYN